MSKSPRQEQPELADLTLQSKIALQQGEKLCTRANALTSTSAQCVIDVLALDAKVRWVTEAVSEQLKLAAAVAKTLMQKRAEMHQHLGEWERLKLGHVDSLDAVLDSLGSQVVPPDLHQPLSDSDLFGSQHSDEEEAADVFPHSSPASTLREPLLVRKLRRRTDRRKWKTLRDFVDERAIEDVYESMEIDRSALEEAIDPKDESCGTLQAAITAIQNALPMPLPLPSLKGMITSQDNASSLMAANLENLASHYGQMAEALHDAESGEIIAEEDLSEMKRDTNMLAVIVAELEENMIIVESQHDRLLQNKSGIEGVLKLLPGILDDLDELGEIMTVMLTRQHSIDADCRDRLESLQERLLTIESLRKEYVAYHHSFNKVLVELARRQAYREASRKIVEGMMSQLDALVQEERAIRADFNAEHGLHMPDDLSTCIQTLPPRWEIQTNTEDEVEVPPCIDADLLAEAKERISGKEGVGRSQSLSS